jgi:hypothetical protein
VRTSGTGGTSCSRGCFGGIGKTYCTGGTSGSRGRSGGIGKTSGSISVGGAVLEFLGITLIIISRLFSSSVDVSQFSN